MRDFTTKEYWSDLRSKTHLESRLISLNKDHPEITSYSRYRPIVVTSYICKFIETIIMEQVRESDCSKMTINQFGFIKGVSID